MGALDINTADIIITVPDDILGLFEPVSAIMYLNIEDAEFEAWRKDVKRPGAGALSSLFRHETYHAFQTWTTGYQYARTLRLWEAFTKYSYDMRDSVIRRFMLGLFWDIASSWLLRRRSAAGREQRLRGRLVHRRVRLLIDLKGRGSDGTFFGALSPEMFRILSEDFRVHTRAGADGISSDDVLEAGAVGHELAVRLAANPALDPTTFRDDPALTSLCRDEENFERSGFGEPIRQRAIARS